MRLLMAGADRRRSFYIETFHVSKFMFFTARHLQSSRRARPVSRGSKVVEMGPRSLLRVGRAGFACGWRK